MNFIVKIRFDPEHKIYFVYETDVPGLNVEAATVDEVIEIVRDVAPDLLGDKISGARFTFNLDLPAVV